MITDEQIRVLNSYVQDLCRAELSVIDRKKDLIDYLEEEGFGKFGENLAKDVKKSVDRDNRMPPTQKDANPHPVNLFANDKSFFGKWKTTEGYLVEVTESNNEYILGYMLKDPQGKVTDNNPLSWNNNGRGIVGSTVGDLQKRINENEM